MPRIGRKMPILHDSITVHEKPHLFGAMKGADAMELNLRYITHLDDIKDISNKTLKSMLNG